MRRALLVVCAAGTLLACPVALAHTANPNMSSVIRSIEPRVAGLRLDVVGGEQLLVRNDTGRTITLFGYEGDRYARLLPSGAVQLNRNSPAYYLNQDVFGDVAVPAHARIGAQPDWTTVARDGRLQWHDHRMHYMGRGTPPGIRDTSKRQKYRDYAIPIQVGSTRSTVRGTIWWSPSASGVPPTAAIAALALAALAGGALVVVVRRRRAAPASSGREAW